MGNNFSRSRKNKDDNASICTNYQIQGTSVSRLLTCQSCKREYNLREKLPICLACDHTFCAGCILNNPYTLCFSCKASSSSNPKKNFDLIKILEQIDEVSNKQESQTALLSNFDDIYSHEILSVIKYSFWKKEFNLGSYTGELFEDKRHGIGKMVLNANDVYEGEWKKDKRHGIGKMVYYRHRVYEGEWKEGKIHGIGQMVFNDGRNYEGEWKEDKRHGIGKMVLNDNGIYEGEFKEGKRHGIGKMVWNNGSLYEGEWNEGKKHGIGKMVYNDGSLYEGEWNEGKKHGIGKMVWNDGSLYEGEFKEEKKNGRGLFTYSNGNKEIQDWNEGALRN